MSGRHHALRPAACTICTPSADNQLPCSMPRTDARAGQLCGLGSLSALLASSRAISTLPTSALGVQQQGWLPNQAQMASSRMKAVTASNKHAHGSKASHASQQPRCACLVFGVQANSALLLTITSTVFMMARMTFQWRPSSTFSTPQSVWVKPECAGGFHPLQLASACLMLRMRRFVLRSRNTTCSRRQTTLHLESLCSLH